MDRSFLGFISLCGVPEGRVDLDTSDYGWQSCCIDRNRCICALAAKALRQFTPRRCLDDSLVLRSEGNCRRAYLSQFCPVAKAAEVFGDRWTPIIMRELCFGPRVFGELLAAAPLISRTVLAQRLKELAQAGVIHIEAKTKGKGHLYRLTPAGEDFRPIVESLSIWGQRWGQGLIGPDDLDPGMLVWGMRRRIDPAEIPPQGFVIRFDFRGIPKSCHSPRYWWLVLRPEEIEVCLKAPERDVDVVIAADLEG